MKNFSDVLDFYFTHDGSTNMMEHLNSGSNTVELVPGGMNKKVTDDNKKDFIKKKCHYIGYLCVQDQLNSLCEGFFNVIP